MEAPFQIVGCLLASKPADPLIDGFVAAVRRERAVVTARDAKGATFVRFNARDAKLVEMACAALAGPGGRALRFGFACAVKDRAEVGQDALSISNHCIAQAHELAAAARRGEVLVSPQLSVLLMESGFTLQANEVSVAGGRKIMACALDLAAPAAPDDPAPEEPPERQPFAALEADLDARLARLEARLATIEQLEQRVDRLQRIGAEVDGKIATIESHRKMVEEVQSRANGIVNMLQDINVNLDMLGEQRAVVDHVGEKLARLDFTLQEAHNTMRALQREREVAERIEQSIKALRTRSGAPKPALQGEVLTATPEAKS